VADVSDLFVPPNDPYFHILFFRSRISPIIRSDGTILLLEGCASGLLYLTASRRPSKRDGAMAKVKPIISARKAAETLPGAGYVRACQHSQLV
jgi:hypothetical protein